MLGSEGLDKELLYMLLGLTLYRAGGEQSFTAKEIDDIKLVVGGLKVAYIEAGEKILLRTYPPVPVGPARDA